MIDNYIEATTAKEHIPGFSVTIVQNGESIVGFHASIVPLGA